jgi:hypothetical protein
VFLLEDLLVDSRDWHITHLVIALSASQASDAVLVATSQVNLVSSEGGDLALNLTAGTLRTAPRYDRTKARLAGLTTTRREPPASSQAADSRAASSPLGQGEGDYGHSRALQEEGPEGQAGFAESYEPFATVESAAARATEDRLKPRPAEKASPQL